MKTTLEIKTNNHEIPLLSYEELTERERKDLDYIDNPEELGFDFFRYRGNVYDLCDIVRIDENSPFSKKWDGYLSNSYFSGILVKVCDNRESVICARYYS